ncbi:ATP-binding protein [bacterium]|nr:ATP-binding protein [bacterium]
MITIGSHTSNIRRAVRKLVNFVVNNAPDATVDDDDLAMVLSEALANAIIHGNRRNPRRKVVAQASIDRRKVVFKVVDEGKGFDHSNLPCPTDPENFRKTYGRGLFLIRQFMDRVVFNRSGNEMVMIKNLKVI